MDVNRVDSVGFLSASNGLFVWSTVFVSMTWNKAEDRRESPRIPRMINFNVSLAESALMDVDLDGRISQNGRDPERQESWKESRRDAHINGSTNPPIETPANIENPENPQHLKTLLKSQDRCNLAMHYHKKNPIYLITAPSRDIRSLIPFGFLFNRIQSFGFFFDPCASWRLIFK